MKKISVFLIDDGDDYKFYLKLFLAESSISVKGSLSHDLFLKQPVLEVIPDIAIVSFDDTPLKTEQTIGLLRKKYSSVKILVNSMYNNQKSVRAVKAMAVEGLIFKGDRDRSQILIALDKINKGEKFVSEVK